MRNLVMSWVLLLFLVASASSQQQHALSERGRSKTPDPGNGVSLERQPAAQPPLEIRLANTVTDAVTDPDDHVRCFFTLKQLLDLRPIPGVAKLTEADQSRLLSAVVKAVDETSATELTPEQKGEFIAAFAGELDGHLVGKSPGEALTTIMAALYRIQAEAMKNYPYYEAAKTREGLKQKVLEDTGNRPPVIAEFARNTNWYKTNDPVATFANTLDLLRESLPQGDPQVTKTEEAVDSTRSAIIATTQLGSAAVDTARAELNSFARPLDIGCAYQILSWNDTRLTFGRSVADEFIAVQITIRNLNPKEEFLVHNAMLSVDTDINGAVGRYFEGVDKIEVEAYNNAGESLTARGIVGNSISAASALLSTLQPIVNVTNFSNAVAAFNGGVPKGWTALSPDHQKEQLLMIANNGFSATSNFKTVVPKSSAATFFTWFPAKPFLEGWWVQDCARKMVLPQNPIVGPKPQLSLDLQQARSSVCNDLTVGQLKIVPYKKWSSISDELFRELSLAVVAGIHVREESKNQATITDLKCPKNAKGQLDLSKPSPSGTIGCDITGENLDKVTKLRLENAGNLVDPSRPEGIISEVSNDNASAKVSFNLSDLISAPGDSYNVFAVGKDGTETSTGQRIYLNKDKDVTLTSVEPANLDLSKQPPPSVNLIGTNLDKLKNVGLSASAGADCKKVQISNTTGTRATMDVSSASLTNGKWTIYLEDCTDPNKTNLTLTVTGVAQPKRRVKTRNGPKALPKEPAPNIKK